MPDLTLNLMRLSCDVHTDPGGCAVAGDGTAPQGADPLHQAVLQVTAQDPRLGSICVPTTPLAHRSNTHT